MAERPAMLLLKMIETANTRGIKVNIEYLRGILSKMREDEALILYDDVFDYTGDYTAQQQLRGEVSILKFLKLLYQDNDGFLTVPKDLPELTHAHFSNYDLDVIDKYIK